MIANGVWTRFLISVMTLRSKVKVKYGTISLIAYNANFLFRNVDRGCSYLAFLLLILVDYKLALLYNFTSVNINIPLCRRDESKTSFPLEEGIFVSSRVFVHKILVS